MPTGIAASDRKLVLGVFGVFVFLVLATAVLSPPPEQAGSPIPSTYSAQSAGAEGAYRLLGKLGYPVRRWASPPTELDGDPQQTLLILAEPIQPPGKLEKEALAKFVEKGGHVLFTGSSIQIYFPDAALGKEIPEPGWKTFPSTLPTRITRNAQRITLQPQAFWRPLGAGQLLLYGNEDKPVVVSWSRGIGYITWWAGSTPLTNAGITRDDNLTFFLNSVGNWNTSASYKIYWDEYFHGQRSSVWSYVGKTSLAWSGLQLGLLAIAVLWTFSRRSGPLFVPPGVSRLSPLEFVETLGGLYERARAASSAISIVAVRLRTLLARQLGLPVTTSNAEFAEAAKSRLGWKDAGLAEALNEADRAACSARVYPQAALNLVRKLEGLSDRLDIRSQIRREKN